MFASNVTRAENIAATVEDYAQALAECRNDELAAAELRQLIREMRPQIAQNLNQFTGQEYQKVTQALKRLDQLVSP